MPERAADIVREFHDTFGLPTRSTPALVAAPLTQPRQRLLDEEVEEVAEALADGDLPVLAQQRLPVGVELAHVRPVHLGEHRVQVDADGKPLLREDGKVLKSELYRAPDVAGVLAAQREVADV